MIVTDRQVANGEADALHIGLDVQKASIAALVTGTELSALYSKVGESGTLVIHWGSASAYLDAIDPPVQIEPGGDLLGVVMKFIKL